MNSLNNEFKCVLMFYNELDYHLSLNLALKLLEKLDSHIVECDIYDKLNIIISRILFLQGKYKESINYVNNCSESEQSLLLRAKISSSYNCYLCKNTYYRLLFYNDKYLPQFINYCLDEVDLGLLYILSVYEPIPANKITSKLTDFVNCWDNTINLPFYKDILHNYTHLHRLVDIESYQAVNFDFQYVNDLNSIISDHYGTKTHKLSFSTENPINVIKEFTDFIVKQGLDVNVEFKLKTKFSVDLNSRPLEESKSNRGSRESFRRQKTIESTHWHTSMPLKLFNSLSKLVSHGDNPKDTFDSLYHKEDEAALQNDYNVVTLNSIVFKIFKKSDLAGFIAFKLFINLLFRYNYNGLLCTNNEVELIIALISLYKLLNQWINTTVSLFSHPLLNCIYMENSHVPSFVELLWNKFHKIDIFKFMMIIIKALSLQKIGYPLPMSEILLVCSFIVKNTLPMRSLIATELNSFVIIVHKWSELLQKRLIYNGFYYFKTPLTINNDYYFIDNSRLLDYFMRTHIPVLCLDKISPSFMDKISKLYGSRRSYNGIKCKYYIKLLRCLSHQFKLCSMEKFINDDIHQLLSVANSILDKSVHYLIVNKFIPKYGSDLLVSCLDIFNNLAILLVENQLRTHDSFNNLNWMNNKEHYSVDVRMGGISVIVISNLIFKLFILVEQFNFNHAVTNVIDQLQKMILLSALLIHYELFNLLYIKRHHISPKLDFEQSHMVTTLLSMLIISALIKSGFLVDNLINILGVLLQVDHVYRELLDDSVEMKYFSDNLQSLSFKWGFYDTTPNLFSYPTSHRVIHLPTYIISVCTSLFNTRLITSYCAELQLSETSPYTSSTNICKRLDEAKEIELDNWISISFAQTYAVNIYIGIPSPFDKVREKIKRYDKSANISFFKMDIRSCVMAVHIHRYLNGMEMIGTDLLSLNSCDYIASHDDSTLENRDLIVSLCETIDSSVITHGPDNVMFYKSLRIPYLNLLLGTKLDDPIYPFEKLLFNVNSMNITELLALSYKALTALPMSHDAIFANIILRIKKCSLSVHSFNENTCDGEVDIDQKFNIGTLHTDDNETFSNLFKLLQQEICKYSSNNRIIGYRELSNDQDMILGREFTIHRLEKCYILYIALGIIHKIFLGDQINICLLYALNILTLVSANGNVPVKGHSISNPNFVTSILSSIGRIKWNIDKILENYDTLTAISTLLLVGKLFCRVYDYLHLESMIKIAMSLYIKGLEIAANVTFMTNNAVTRGKRDENYFNDLLTLLECKTGDIYHILQYCYSKCLKLMFKHPFLAISNVEDIVRVIIDNNAKYCNMANYVAIHAIKYNNNIVSSLQVSNLLQSISANYNIVIDFDVFGYGLIKNSTNSDTQHLINSLKVLSSLLVNYINSALESVETKFIKHVNEFSTLICDYINKMPDESHIFNTTIKGSLASLGKGRWIVTGYHCISNLCNINLTIESITTILSKIAKKHYNSHYDIDKLVPINDQMTDSLELLINKCPDTLSLPLTYNHFLSKSDCENLIELINTENEDKSMFSRYTVDTATIDIKLIKNLKLLLAVITKIDIINKSKAYERLCNAFINGCQKILYCQPPIDTTQESNSVLYKFVRIEIRDGVTVFASDRWAKQQRLNSFRQATSALSSATTPPHTV